MAKSVAHERKETIYPEPKYHRLLRASSAINGSGISAEVNKALRYYYDSLSEKEREDILAKAKNKF